MANRNSTQQTFAAGSPRTALRATVIHLTPMLFAAVLVGCSTKAQTRGGSQATPPAQAVQPTGAAPAAAESGYAPPPYEEPAVSSPVVEDQSTAPPVFKDEGSEQAQEESVAQPEVFAEEGTEAKVEQDAAPEPQQFAEQAAAVAEEEPFTQEPSVDKEEAAKDGGTVAQQQFTDEAAPAMDEDVIAEQFTDDAAPHGEDSVVAEQFSDDTAPRKEDDVVAEQFTDDAAPRKEDDVIAQQQFSDDAGATPEEVTAPEVYKDDVAEAAPEALAREPETFSDEKVAQAEEPKAPAVTMLPVTVTVEAEPLFDFDKYSIRADARSKLDDLIQQLKAVTYGDIIAVGFADPIGTAKYNLGLSERRAASVKRYLVSKGIPAGRIKTEGRGKTEEYASLKKCSGLHKQRLIACLQPDRRVEVTVTAERQQ